MKGKRNDFDKISQIYIQFTEENKENLVKTAKSLLKVQKSNLAMLTPADAPVPPNETEKGKGLA